jgi:glycosyltransferase involved in cell wall biosynthesis
MSAKRSVAHFAPISLDRSSGMGRVAVYWRDAIRNRGWDFRHYGIEEVPLPRLKPLWGLSAKQTWSHSGESTDLFLAHEPVAGTLQQSLIPTVLFSHGLEVRSQQFCPSESDTSSSSPRAMLMRPFWNWRERQTALALKGCPLLLLINEDDRDYVLSRYNRDPRDIFVFRNGVDPSSLQAEQQPWDVPTVLFYGSWLERKGKSVLIRSAQRLASTGLKIRWLLVGTGKSEQDVLADWPINLRELVEVMPHVSPSDDDSIYARATIFLLPSFFEGQPLTLLQAMESARCVISTRCCGQKDIVRHGQNGFLFTPGNCDELAELIAMTIANRELRLRTAAQAKLDMMSRRWSMVSDDVARRLESFLVEREILG